MWFNENAFWKTTTTKVDLGDCKSYQNIQLFKHKEIYSLTNNNKKHLQGKTYFLNMKKDNTHFQIALKQSNYKKHFCTEGIFWIHFFFFAWESYLKFEKRSVEIHKQYTHCICITRNRWYCVVVLRSTN